MIISRDTKKKIILCNSSATLNKNEGKIGVEVNHLKMININYPKLTASMLTGVIRYSWWRNCHRSAKRRTLVRIPIPGPTATASEFLGSLAWESACVCVYPFYTSFFLTFISAVCSLCSPHPPSVLWEESSRVLLHRQPSSLPADRIHSAGLVLGCCIHLSFIHLQTLPFRQYVSDSAILGIFIELSPCRQGLIFIYFSFPSD